MQNQRTPLQNRSMHKLFGDISRYCMEHGIDMQTVLEHMKDHRVQVSPEAVKSTWKSLQSTAFSKESTTELTTKEVTATQEEFIKLWADITKTVFQWPSQEAQEFIEHYDNQHN